MRSLGCGMVVYISQSIKRNTAPLRGRSAYLGERYKGSRAGWGWRSLLVVFVGDGSYLRSPSVVCVAEEGARGGASPDSGGMVSGVCVVCSPYEGTRLCWEGSGGSREGSREGVCGRV